MSQEEEVLGKAYDSRLMARLLKYLRPYRWQVAIALVSIFLKSFADVLGPYLTKVAIDRYLSPAKELSSGFWSWLSPRAITGIAQIASMYVGLLVFSFLLEFAANLLHAVDGPEGDVRSAPPDLPPSATAARCLLRQESGRPAGDARYHRRGCVE
jgi:hypothetical protein